MDPLENRQIACYILWRFGLLIGCMIACVPVPVPFRVDALCEPILHRDK